MAYDMAAIEYRGLNAVTNFDLGRYIKRLRHNSAQATTGDAGTFAAASIGGAAPLTPSPDNAPNGIGLDFYQHSDGGAVAASGGGVAANPSSALGILLQSSKFKEMLERTTCMAEDGDTATSPPESDNQAMPTSRGCFPDDVRTYFDSPNDGVAYGEDVSFGDLDAFVSTIFHCELDC